MWHELSIQPKAPSLQPSDLLEERHHQVIYEKTQNEEAEVKLFIKVTLKMSITLRGRVIAMRIKVLL